MLRPLQDQNEAMAIGGHRGSGPGTRIKAPTGVEPVMEDLQSSALPLGYGAEQLQKLLPGNDLCKHYLGASSRTPRLVESARG